MSNFIHVTSNEILDDELRSLLVLVEAKTLAIESLHTAARARKRRGEDTFGIEESIDLELATLAGYKRAADNRRKELGL
jgi:hypothetical protein